MSFQVFMTVVDGAVILFLGGFLLSVVEEGSDI